jgi:hypothetical protein
LLYLFIKAIKVIKVLSLKIKVLSLTCVPYLSYHCLSLVYIFTNAMEIHSDGGRRLMFTHLPQRCIIKIFTVSGYLVREIRVPEDSMIPFSGYTVSSEGIVHWDLCDLDGREVAPGLYFY